MNAVEAGVRVAEKFGLRVEKPVLLRSTNNVVAWLRPPSVVAKIGVGHRPGLPTEVSVASELSVLGAPVVPLAPEIPAAVRLLDDFKISFWRYHPQPPDVDIPAEQVAAALLHLHAAYARISAKLRVELPSYLAELRSVSELLSDAKRLSALPENDRHLLIRAFDHLWNRLHVGSSTDTHVVIHVSTSVQHSAS